MPTARLGSFIVDWLQRARHGFLNVTYRGAVIARDVRGLAVGNRGAVHPMDVNIEPSNLCNADCVFCGYQFQTRVHGDMPVHDGLKIIDAAKRNGVQRLGLTPVAGEPLVHRGLEQFIRAAKEPPNPLKVGLTTNAILLTPGRYVSLVSAGNRQH
jgi:MoaA/NifB/PqqE/SkfB family radical SAM enzyme